MIQNLLVCKTVLAWRIFLVRKILIDLKWESRALRNEREIYVWNCWCY
jgi:hypothetical protein